MPGKKKISETKGHRKIGLYFTRGVAARRNLTTDPYSMSEGIEAEILGEKHGDSSAASVNPIEVVKKKTASKAAETERSATSSTARESTVNSEKSNTVTGENTTERENADSANHTANPSTVNKNSNPETAATTGDLNKILEAINQLEKKMEEKLDKKSAEILEGMDSKLDKLCQKVADIEVSLNYAHKEIEDIKQKKAEYERQQKRLKERVDSCQKEVKETKSGITNMRQYVDEQVNKMERYTRSFSVRIHNIPELPENGSPMDYNKTVAKILVEKKIIPEQEAEGAEKEIETSHPIGPRGSQSLIVRFHSRPFRNRVLREAKKKMRQDTETENPIRIVEDMTKEDYAAKKRAIPLMNEAYAQGKKVKFRNGELVIDGKIITY